MLVSVGHDNVLPAPAWRLHGTESRLHFPAGLFYFFFLTLHMLLHALHISNIFPGTQPKDPYHDSILKVP